MISRAISVVSGFTLVSGQKSLALKVPSGSEIGVTIATIGGASGGTLTMDYVVSTPTVDAAMQASSSTAVWNTNAVVWTASTPDTAPVKVYSDMWVRFNCTAGSGTAVVDPSGVQVPVGTGLVPSLSGPQVAVLSGGLSGKTLLLTLDGSNRPVTVTKGANVFTITRTDSTHITVALPNPGGLPDSVISLVTTATGEGLSAIGNFI